MFRLLLTCYFTHGFAETNKPNVAWFPNVIVLILPCMLYIIFHEEKKKKKKIFQLGILCCFVYLW